MLVLSRKVGEKIVIGDNVVIEILQIKGNRVRLGITAPENVVVLRGELSPQSPQGPGGGQIIVEIELPPETNAEAA